VRRYLREFLSDGRVMDIHPVLRRLVLETMILPFRPREAAHAYRAVWSEGGSPLLVHGRDLARELSRAWGDGTQVALAMRYGRPAIRDVLPALVRQVDQVDVLLLYPHAAASTTGSAVAEIYRVLGQLWDAPPVRILDPWYDHPAYLRSLGKVYGEALEAFEPDHILFSYHGIPTRHLERSAPFHSCATSTERCHRTGAARGGCYRAQCLETSHGVAREMGLADGSWSSAFQSRFGKDPWVGPETEATLRELARNGTRRVAVACPGFAADCLETLEEMGIRGRDAFLEEGGEEFLLLPCPNSHPAWVEGLVSILRPRADALA
jgi:ferrochelatase